MISFREFDRVAFGGGDLTRRAAGADAFGECDGAVSALLIGCGDREDQSVGECGLRGHVLCFLKLKSAPKFLRRVVI